MKKEETPIILSKKRKATSQAEAIKIFQSQVTDEIEIIQSPVFKSIFQIFSHHHHTKCK